MVRWMRGLPPEIRNPNSDKSRARVEIRKKAEIRSPNQACCEKAKEAFRDDAAHQLHLRVCLVAGNLFCVGP